MMNIGIGCDECEGRGYCYIGQDNGVDDTIYYPCPNCSAPDVPERDYTDSNEDEAMEADMAIRTEPPMDVAKDMMAYVHLVWEGRFELQRLEEQLWSAQQNLVIAKARAEQVIIEAAGGDKALGANEDARKRALIIALADAPEAAEYREQQGTVMRCERAVAEKRIGLECDLDQQTARRYIIRAAEVAAGRNGDGNN